MNLPYASELQWDHNGLSTDPESWFERTAEDAEVGDKVPDLVAAYRALTSEEVLDKTIDLLSYSIVERTEENEEIIHHDYYDPGDVPPLDAITILALRNALRSWAESVVPSSAVYVDHFDIKPSDYLEYGLTVNDKYIITNIV